MASLGTTSLLVFCLFLTTVICQQPQQSVLPVTTVSDGGTFNIYCDTSRVVTDNLATLLQLSITRTLPNTLVTADIVVYTISPPNPVVKFPDSRPWNVTYTGANNAMKIVVNVTDAMCGDAGTYQCSISYQKQGSSKFIDAESSVNLTVTSGVSSFDFIMSYPSEQPLYAAGENITLTCSATGPNTLVFLWEECYTDRSTISGYTCYAIQNQGIDNKTPGPPIGSGSCLRYSMVSVYTFLVQQTSDYRCTVSNSGQAYGNKTISIQTGTTPAPGEQTGKAGDPAPVGMIVGIIIGCIALIAIVIIIIFVVRYRRRSKEGNYKSNDQPDASRESNLHHAPPPVFFPSSKTSKDEKDIKVSGTTNEALDTSYDSRDSVSKGPPRYINADADAQGPPRYEKETHRGRQNKGYEEEDRSKNGGHGRSRQPREGEERRHRSRDYDEEPRRIRYSTDDGTDERDLGNPDIGTSI